MTGLGVPGSFLLPSMCHIGCKEGICRLKRKVDDHSPPHAPHATSPYACYMLPLHGTSLCVQHQHNNGPHHHSPVGHCILAGIQYTPHPRGTIASLPTPSPAAPAAQPQDLPQSKTVASEHAPTTHEQESAIPSYTTAYVSIDGRSEKMTNTDVALLGKNRFESTIPQGIELPTARVRSANERVRCEERSFVVPSEVTLRAKIWGTPMDNEKGGPRCILALHGWLDNASSFDILAPMLAESGAYVVCLDLAGHGLSDHRQPQGGYYLWDMIDDILGVVDDLEWETFTLIGHSTGGHIGAAFAATFTSRVQRLVMVESIGTAIQFKDTEPREMAAFIRRRREMNKWGKATRVYDSFEDAARARTRGFTKVSLEAARLLCERGLEPVLPRADSGSSSSCVIEGELRYVWRTDPRLTLWAYLHCAESAIHQFFSAIECPVFVMIGEKSGLFNFETPKYVTRLQAFKHLSTAVVPGGHHLHLEQEFVGRVFERIVGFLGS
ncbi:uncharacterized protein SPPG_05578 [Spizellomyces punctatus DAOM BR117]|uniref:AB hydrolase-1 domain-containing protein n=1 Tax=Spizellomyces punctatus (strain DAOM BR117) TaxID=645134 RepID=A0A0L0HCT4_SPIPD|nr:uncharacterized protein SPPG_05578 [Spizellomyces punctatus DAOM BR117]KNC99330.1 hypothetical protein SPPG_05578 [Spizellomyces punctatus DAOM BR117]|eukprot:XP_016607370.1 hypothetical protein SPPG_05578 [Spizellomyces punctatus DAOM BR117]